MIDRLEMLKKRLQRIYDLAIAADNEKHFFLWLYDYVRVFEREDEMEGFFEVVKQDRENDFGRIHELEPLAIKEIDKVYKQVTKYVADHKITNEVIKKELGEYEMAKKGEYSSSRGHLEDLYDKLSYALMTMAEDGTVEDLKFAQGFGKVSDERRIVEWTFSPSYTEYDMLKDGLKKIQETRLWYSWDKITLAFRTIDDYKHEVVKELLDTKRHFEAVNWSGLHTEMMGIIDEKNNRTSRAYEFISKDYRYYLAKVQTNSLDFVQNSPLVAQRKSETQSVGTVTAPLEVKWSLSKDENWVNLVVNTKRYSYRRDLDYAGILLAALDDSEDGCVICEDIYGKMVDAVNPEVKYPKRVPYDAGRALNTKLYNDLGVGEFLIPKLYDVRFNDRYTRQVN